MRVSELLQGFRGLLLGDIDDSGWHVAGFDLGLFERVDGNDDVDYDIARSGHELLADIEAHKARVAHLEAVEKAARVYVGAYCKAVYGNNTDPSPVCAAEWNALCEALDPESRS